MDEYEYLLDLRKLFKMSVSLIIASGVDRYLDMLMKGKFADNNRFNNHIVIREVAGNIICRRLYRGYPNNIAQPIPPHPQSFP
jgi:hypothetical protein